MKTTVFAGKGGVGKSTMAAAYALFQAQHLKVAILNYDGAHAIPRILNIESPPPNKFSPTGIENIYLSLLASPSIQFVDEINRSNQEQRMAYLKQFKGDYGYLAYVDLVSSFTGVPCDLSQIGKFCALVEHSHKAQEKEFSQIIIDVEATAALESMLTSSRRLIDRIRGTVQKHRTLLTLAAVTFPLVGDFLKSEYFSNFNNYSVRLERTVSFLQNADYFLVCIPEETPVLEMLQVARIVESFGATIAGYIINNIRGEEGETEQIKLVREICGNKLLLMVNHQIGVTHGEERQQAIREISQLFE